MGCLQTLSGIPLDCAGNVGGILEVYIANFDDVKSVTITDDIIKTITMAETAKFKRYSFKKGTGSMAPSLNAGDGGSNFVATTLTLQFNRMETAKRTEMAALAVGELVAIVKDANGKYWYMGYSTPVTATGGDSTTGTAFTDTNMYALTLVANEATYPYEVDAAAIADIID